MLTTTSYTSKFNDKGGHDQGHVFSPHNNVHHLDREVLVGSTSRSIQTLNMHRMRTLQKSSPSSSTDPLQDRDQRIDLARTATIPDNATTMRASSNTCPSSKPLYATSSRPVVVDAVDAMLLHLLTSPASTCSKTTPMRGITTL